MPRVSWNERRSTTVIAAGAWSTVSDVRVPVTSTGGCGTTSVSGLAAAATSRLMPRMVMVRLPHAPSRRMRLEVEGQIRGEPARRSDVVLRVADLALGDHVSVVAEV